MAWRDWIPERIKQARVSSGLLQVELANKVNVYPQLISKYEAGRVTPSIDTIERIAEVTGLPLEWFFQSPQATPAGRRVRDALARLARAEGDLAAARVELLPLAQADDELIP